jgi:hypothetical protein
MFAKPMRQRFTLLSTLLLMSAASLSGCSATQAGDEAVAARSGNVSIEVEGQTESACGSSCYGRCWSCILGVCENICQ